MGQVLLQKELTILEGESLSDILDCRSLIPVGIYMPTVWTSANLAFKTSLDGVRFLRFDVDQVEKTFTVAADRYVNLDPTEFAGVAFLKIVSGTNAAPINQAGRRILGIAFRSIK